MRKTASTVVAHVFKPDYEGAKLTAQKIELAKKLIKVGTATKDDSAVQFVLFNSAQNIASQQGDLATAFVAIDQIAAGFEINRIEMKVGECENGGKCRLSRTRWPNLSQQQRWQDLRGEGWYEVRVVGGKRTR